MFEAIGRRCFAAETHDAVAALPFVETFVNGDDIGQPRIRFAAFDVASEVFFEDRFASVRLGSEVLVENHDVRTILRGRYVPRLVEIVQELRILFEESALRDRPTIVRFRRVWEIASPFWDRRVVCRGSFFGFCCCLDLRSELLCLSY